MRRCVSSGKTAHKAGKGRVTVTEHYITDSSPACRASEPMASALVRNTAPALQIIGFHNTRPWPRSEKVKRVRNQSWDVGCRRTVWL